MSPRGIWYTQVSGIWQTVWLKTVPTRHIPDLKISSDSAAGSISVRPILASSVGTSEQVRVIVLDGDQEVARHQAAASGVPLTLTISQPQLWSPDSPHLYALQVELLGSQGQILDQVSSYAGIRRVGKSRDRNGHLRFTLNGKPLFHWGPLDQGWWPDGLLTPPSQDAMLFDIRFLKSAGFNMIRKHIKVEPRRYYYLCDREGMLVWQDRVSGGAQPPWTRLAPKGHQPTRRRDPPGLSRPCRHRPVTPSKIPNTTCISWLRQRTFCADGTCVSTMTIRSWSKSSKASVPEAPV